MKDNEKGELIPCGYPFPTLAKLSDCELTEAGNGKQPKLKPCPFCGRKMVLCKEAHKNKNGKQIITQYYMHEEYDINKEEICILDEICMPFAIGAGDATENYIGEYAEKWNRRADNDR